MRSNPQRRLSRAVAAAALTLLFVSVLGTVAVAQEAGVSVSVPVVDDGSINADGDLSEWADLPVTVTVDGPQPSSDPGTSGRLRWQVAADSTTVYLAATVTDDVIAVGDNPERYWDDDSLEFYLNLSGDLTASEYGAGVSQMRVTPLGLNDQSSTSLTLNGNNVEQFAVDGVTFATNDGWGTELAIDVSEFAGPTEGERFGIQIHLNGSSGEGRDIKLIWSARDEFDTSFEDPSVFGQGVFVSNTEPEVIVEDQEAEASEALGPEISELESSGAEVITASEQQRSLLLAAVASSVTVLVAGLWFERKRKRDEARHSAESQVEEVDVSS